MTARILIVDDEPLNVDYLEQELDSHGFVTDTAATGLEALERVAADPPDLVLMDVMMPEMDGITALRIMKGDPDTRLIPVVVMTALNAVEDRVRGIEAGADDFLSKPVDERELLARINTALSLKRTIDEAVGELRASVAHLERYGRQERDVAVLAMVWRLSDASLPDEAVAFVARSSRDVAAARIRDLGGSPTETPGDLLVAIFEGSDIVDRSTAAVEAALDAIEENRTDRSAGRTAAVTTSVAISVGRARIGSSRTTDSSATRWVFAAEGAPVDRAVELARGPTGAGLLVTEEVATAVRSGFSLAPLGDGTYSVKAPLDKGEGSIDGALNSRQISTILVTGVVGSTKTAERLGDRAWSELLRSFERVVREQLVLFGGQELAATGDGFQLSFDSPALAIRCALASVEGAAPLGLTIRVGIHTGEVEQLEGQLRGIAVYVAGRISARAVAGEVLVSATTRELATGAGFDFTDRGVHSLPGMPEARQLFAVHPSITSHDTAAGDERPLRRSAKEGMTEYPAGLTEREVDVLRLVAIGLSDADVAQQLYLSVRTVNAHLRAVYRKLGVRSRAAAGRFAEENGLL